MADKRRSMATMPKWRDLSAAMPPPSMAVQPPPQPEQYEGTTLQPELQGGRDAWRGIVNWLSGGMQNQPTSQIVQQELDNPELFMQQGRVYHGSSHLFDTFDLDHLGKGEGAQGFGRGFYFSNDKHTAAGYASEGSGNIPSLYHVNIHADPNTMMEWHKPISEQSDYVQNALRKVESDPSTLARDVYRKLSGTFDPKNRGKIFGSEGTPQQEAAATQKLQDLGIRGVRYNGTYGADNRGERNYVVYDPKDISIVSRENVPPPEVPQ